MGCPYNRRILQNTQTKPQHKFDFAFFHVLAAVDNVFLLSLQKELAPNKCDQAIIEVLIPSALFYIALQVKQIGN